MADDDELVVAGLAAMLWPFRRRIAVAGAIGRDKPLCGSVDIALYDPFARPGFDRLGLRGLLNTGGVRRAVVYSFSFRADAVTRALDAGAGGYLSKATPAAGLVAQLERVAAGEIVVDHRPAPAPSPPQVRTWPGRDAGLSERESEVVALASLGHRNAEIAEALFISVDTVKTHLSRAFRKLGLSNRTQLASFALNDGTFRRWSRA